MAGAPGKPLASSTGAAGPYVPASRSLAEITFKGVFLGIVLSILLGAANTYLGLKAGLTVAAAIPAAVVSMAVLRAFRKHNILENNMVQTIASSGTAVASGAIFTIPAMVILGEWTTVRYFETTLIAICGGMLGVLFTVPIRRALIVEEKLPYPEGIATAEVLKAGEGAGTGVGLLALGGGLGALYKLMEAAFRVFAETAGGTLRVGAKSVLGWGVNLSAALAGVGAIIGLRIALLVFMGGLMGWFVGIPLYTAIAGDVYADPDLTDEDPSLFERAGNDYENLPTTVWSRRIRYLGVGAMLVGGVWSLVKLRKPLGRAIAQGVRATQGATAAAGASAAAAIGGTAAAAVPRTEREIPFRLVALGVLVAIVPITLLYGTFTGSWAVAGVLALIMVVTGFLFSAVGAYMAGLVGSSNTPISGVTILTLLVSAITLVLLGVEAGVGVPAAILVAGVICVGGAIASDNLQDLKAGHLLGATPWKQQLMIMVGAVASAFAIAPVMNLLLQGDAGGGFGSPTLPAAQASLMASVSQGIFGAGLPYGMIAIGGALAVALILADKALEKAGSTFRTPVMPVAVGIYLPVGLSVPIFFGGLAAFAVEKVHARRVARAADAHKPAWREAAERGVRNTILFASGLIAGEALMGIVTSGLSQAAWTRDGFAKFDVLDYDYGWAGMAVLGYLVFLAAYVGIRERARLRKA